MNSLNDLSKAAYSTSVSKGWHDKPIELGTELALIHTEVTEAFDAYVLSTTSPEEKVNHYAEELADVIIRTFDSCGKRNFNLNKHASLLIGEVTLEGIYSMSPWEENLRTETFLLQLHSKVSHIMETFRRASEEELDDQLAKGFADLVVFTIGYSKNVGIPVIEELSKKMEKNKNRPFKHGNKRA